MVNMFTSNKRILFFSGLFLLVALFVSVFYFFSKVLIYYPDYYIEDNIVYSTKNKPVLNITLFIVDKKNNEVNMQIRGRNFIKVNEFIQTGCAVENVINWKCMGFEVVDGVFLNDSSDKKGFTKLSVILRYLLSFINNGK